MQFTLYLHIEYLVEIGISSDPISDRLGYLRGSLIAVGGSGGAGASVAGLSRSVRGVVAAKVDPR